ncbi:NUDIX hydrolase [Citrifermentans bremense]|uniref:DNA mismatch repair protein MutT n=2 Tax=Geobacteraceae TaxID=213422 RepID=A0ABQ0MNQ2_9BACT|nr:MULTISPECIES: NUDIX domain-containing protein [Geobacteraceae]BCG48792.1 NUDIX hydrolase [Citrifermentans bremense]GAW68706.1 DNA mismatch repair protein MutT [Geoanaerobacter pelophilus]
MEQNGFKTSHIVTSVVAVIIDADDRVLLTKRNVPPFQGEWVMPGGKIDLGEPIVAALKREVWEEVGLEVEVGELIDVFEHVTPGEDNYHFIIIYYRCTPLYCDVKHNRDEVAEARWVTCEELAEYKIPAGARFILGKTFKITCQLTPKGN